MRDENKIRNRLKQDFDMLVERGYEVVGVFLQGSQNYNLDYEGSDIDTKAIVLPSFEDIILNAQPASTTSILDTNEHVDIKDIRLMFDCFKKQNVNFMEILFTDYFYMNPKYAELYQPMFDNREAIARYNTFAALNCMSGMAMEKHKALCHPYPNILDKIEKWGYDPKQLHHIIRLWEVMGRYIRNKETYAEMLKSTAPEYLIRVKKSDFYSLKAAKEVAKKYSEEMRETVKEYMVEHKNPVVNKEVDKMMKDVLVSIMKAKLREEVKENF